MQTFDDALQAMVRDCALVSQTGRIVDLTTPRAYRPQITVITYKRLYAPLRRLTDGAHVVDKWMEHRMRKTVYPGEAEYPLSEWDWRWLEGYARNRYYVSMAGDMPALRTNPNFREYVLTPADIRHDELMAGLRTSTGRVDPKH